MADITLHSGSFCDRNNNEISITFFKRTSTPVMTVDPTALSFTSNGGTKQLRVSNYTGTLSISVTGGTGWLSRTQSTSSGVRTYTFTATANTSTSMRNATITLTDANSTVTVGVTQAANTDTFAVSPTSFQYGGTGSTNTFTFTGVPAAGLSYDIPSGVDWVTVSNLTNASVDITTAANNNPTSRTTTVKFYNQDDIDNYVTVTVNQEAGQSSLSVSPSSITYLPAGGTYGITATWTAGTEPTATVTYVQGTGGWMTPTGSGTVTGNTKEWAWTASANYTGSSRTALITVTNGLQSEYVTVSQSSTTPPVVNWEVTPSSITGVSAAGNTYSVTITGAPSGGMSYDVIYGSGSGWVTVSNFSSSGCTVAVGANSGSSQRTATVKFYDLDDIDHYIYLTITQDGTAVAALSVMDSSMSFAAAGGRNQTTVQNIVGTLTTTQPSWITLAMSGEGGTRLVSVHAAANPSSTARSGAVNFDDDRQSPVSMAVSQESASSYVSPSSLTFVGAGETKSFTCTYPSSWSLRTTYHRGSDWLSISVVNLTITANRNTTSYNRTATVTFYDTNTNEEIGTIEVTQYVEAITVSPSQMTVGPTKANTQYTDYYLVTTTAYTYPVTATTSETWLSVVRTNNSNFRVYTSTNSGSIARTGTIAFNVNDQSGVCTITQRSGELDTDKQNLDYGYSGGTQSIDITYDTSLSLSYPSWISMSNVSTSGSSEETPFIGSYNVTVASNTVTSSRSGYISCSTPYAQMSIPVNQAGSPAISVTPSSIDFPYTNDAETLTVSGVPSGGYSTSISYNTGASGWLSTTNTAYNIIITARATTYPSSRTATLTVTNASVPSDSVAIPITQAGNPQVLSVTPNAWTYSSALGTHSFTVTYNASGSITTSVAYEREEGEAEIDWLEVELVEHEEGSETWIYSIDVGPNATRQGRSAMVTFEGDGGGADEVSVYQQPKSNIIYKNNL